MKYLCDTEVTWNYLRVRRFVLLTIYDFVMWNYVCFSLVI